VIAPLCTIAVSAGAALSTSSITHAGGGGVLPNCRLVTLEWHVCRRRRVGDVPGSEVPELYHDFVKYGAPHRLIPVFHHNLLDVITMDEILRALVAAGEGDGLEAMSAGELE
jgi:uncharacterized protein YprB with RNaseH-like and TPR domain